MESTLMTVERTKKYPESFWFAASFLLVCSVLVLRAPLLNYLGYEYSVAMAFILPLILGPLTISLFKSIDRSRETFGKILSQALVRAGILLVIPFCTGILNILYVRNCSLGEGILFYLLIPVVTGIWSVALAGCCAIVFRKSKTWFFIGVVAVLGYAVYLGYATPQIYSYNFIYGFFPGFSYDEVITITPTLILFRMMTLLVASVFILFTARAWSWPAASVPPEETEIPGESFFKWKLFPLFLMLILILGVSWFYRVELGFETSVAYLRKTLGAHMTTVHFEIYYAKHSFTDEELKSVAAEHEFRYNEIAASLQTHDQRTLTSYIYPDAGVQLRMIGTKTTNIAKPWRREIHLSKDSWQQTLKHELVHAMAGEFGMPVIRAHYNIGLVEGLATAIDGMVGNRTLHEYAEAMLVFGIVHHPAQMINPVGFAFRSSAVSYTLMGSFCRFLIDRFGILRFKELYGGRAPEEVYNRSYESLVHEWQEFLSRFRVPLSWKPHIDYYFNRPSIFAKLCARKIALLNAQGYDSLDAHNPMASKAYFLKAIRLSPNSGSYGGLIRAEFAMAEYDSVLHQFIIADSLQRSGLQALALLHGDALLAKGDTAGAGFVYDRLLAEDLSDPLNEAVALRITALAEPTLCRALRWYFVSPAADSVKAHILDSLSHLSSNSLISYLRSTEFIRRGNYDSAITELKGMTEHFHIPLLDGYREQLLGRCYFMRHKYQDARVHFWLSLNYIPNRAYRDRIDDWLDRSAWYERHAGDR